MFRWDLIPNRNGHTLSGRSDNKERSTRQELTNFRECQSTSITDNEVRLIMTTTTTMRDNSIVKRQRRDFKNATTKTTNWLAWWSHVIVTSRSSCNVFPFALGSQIEETEQFYNSKCLLEFLLALNRFTVQINCFHCSIVCSTWTLSQGRELSDTRHSGWNFFSAVK